jgi:hypothetical protein
MPTSAVGHRSQIRSKYWTSSNLQIAGHLNNAHRKRRLRGWLAYSSGESRKCKCGYQGTLNSSKVRSILIIYTLIMAFPQENGRVIVQSGQSDLSVMISSRNLVIRDVVGLAPVKQTWATSWSISRDGWEAEKLSSFCFFPVTVSWSIRACAFVHLLISSLWRVVFLTRIFKYPRHFAWGT